MWTIPPPKIVIETHSLCNRACPTCVRQTDPTRCRWNEDGSKKNIRMKTPFVISLLKQISALDYKGRVALNWYNEPLLDERLPFFVAKCQELGLYVYFITNGDLLTPSLARLFNGVLTEITVSVYDETAAAKVEYLKKVFTDTQLHIAGEHCVTHYSPVPELEDKIKENSMKPCKSIANGRLIITYTGDVAMCCEDIACNWYIGNAHDTPLPELWERQQKIIAPLNETGDRSIFPYCSICPRDSF